MLTKRDFRRIRRDAQTVVRSHLMSEFREYGEYGDLAADTAAEAAIEAVRDFLSDYCHEKRAYEVLQSVADETAAALHEQAGEVS